MTYTPIASITLGSSASSVTFSSIPQTYRDLVLVVQGTLAGGSDRTSGIKMNGETSVYPYVEMYADPNPGSRTASEPAFWPHYVSSGNAIQQVYQIFDYTQTNKHKTILFRGNAPTTTGNFTKRVDAAACRYESTSTVTTLEWLCDSPHVLNAGGTLALYGIEA